jgi:hypothetical protein
MWKFDADVRNAVLVLRGRNEYPSVGRVLTENPGLRAGVGIVFETQFVHIPITPNLIIEVPLAVTRISNE